MIVLATIFVIAQSLDLATYLMAPHLERNLFPMLWEGSTFLIKIGAVITILIGTSYLRYKGIRNPPVAQWAKAVLLAGAMIGFASFGLNAASLSL